MILRVYSGARKGRYLAAEKGTTMIDITTLTTKLGRGPHGCWFSDAKSELSYPEEGNHACFEVEDSSFWFQHRNRCITEVVRSFAPAGPLFDVGGGNGVVAAALEQSGQEVVLVEPGPEGALNARRRGVQTVLCATLEQAEFAEHSLPGVGLFDVLEHISDDVGFLTHLRSLLSPTGKLFLTVPAFRCLWSYEDDHAGHLRRYTLGTLAHALRRAGFEIDYQTYMFWFLPAPVFLLRTVPGLFRRRGTPGLKRTKEAHSRPSGWKGRLLDRALAWELDAIRAKRRVPFGGSCLVAARCV